MRRRVFAAALGAATLLAACGNLRSPHTPATFRGEAMGSTYTLKIAGGHSAALSG